MEDSAEWQMAHRDLSEIDLRFREMAKSSPDFLDRSCFQVLEQNKDLILGPLQPWLTFLGRDKLAELKRVSLGTAQVIRNLRERIFGNDWARLAEFYHLGSPLVAEILCSSPSGAETAFSRCDFIDTASGFKCIEFNCTPNLGGWEIPIITRMHLSIPATASFIAREGIPVTFTDPILTMFRHIFADLRDKRIASDGEVTIGFIVEPGQEAPENHPRIQFFQDEMNRAIQVLGLDISGKIVNCSYPSMALRERSLFLGNRKIDALMELVRLNTPPAIYRLFKGNCIGLYNGPIERILGTETKSGPPVAECRLRTLLGCRASLHRGAHSLVPAGLSRGRRIRRGNQAALRPRRGPPGQVCAQKGRVSRRQTCADGPDCSS